MPAQRSASSRSALVERASSKHARDAESMSGAHSYARSTGTLLGDARTLMFTEWNAVSCSSDVSAAVRSVGVLDRS